MTKDRLKDLADQCGCKAEAIADGFYGKERDDQRWIADLEYAESALRDGELHDLDDTSRDEIESCCDITEAEMAEILQARYDAGMESPPKRKRQAKRKKSAA